MARVGGRGGGPIRRFRPSALAGVPGASVRFLAGLAAIALAREAVALALLTPGEGGRVVALLGRAVVAVLAFDALLALTRRYTARLDVYDDELVYERGVAGRAAASARISQIVGFKSRATLLGRLGGYASLVVETTGREEIRLEDFEGAGEIRDLVAELNRRRFEGRRFEGGRFEGRGADGPRPR